MKQHIVGEFYREKAINERLIEKSVAIAKYLGTRKSFPSFREYPFIFDNDPLKIEAYSSTITLPEDLEGAKKTFEAIKRGVKVEFLKNLVFYGNEIVHREDNSRIGEINILQYEGVRNFEETIEGLYGAAEFIEVETENMRRELYRKIRDPYRHKAGMLLDGQIMVDGDFCFGIHPRLVKQCLRFINNNDGELKGLNWLPEQFSKTPEIFKDSEADLGAIITQTKLDTENRFN